MGLLEKGWILIAQGHPTGFRLLGRWRIKSRNPDVMIEHYPGGNFGFDIGSKERTVEIVDTPFPTKEDAEACLEYIDALNSIAGGYDLELQVHSDETKFKLDGGTGYKMKVLCKEYTNVEKIADGDTQVYKIASIKFEQSG